MTAEQNAAIIKDCYAAFQRGDIEAVLNIFSDDINFVVPGPAQLPTAGTWRGLAGMRDFFSKLGGEIEFTEFNPREFVASGDRVIVLGNYAANLRSNGRSVGSEWVMAWRLRDGKAVEFREYNDTLAVAEAYDARPRAAAG